MGTSSIAATLDDTVIHCSYYHFFDIGDTVSTVDLAVSVKHQYVNSANIANEIVLEEFLISKEYLETKGLLGVTDVEQTVEFHVLNLRYLTDLFIEVREVRNSNPILTRVPVLVGGDNETVEPLPSNPERYIEHEENIPEQEPEKNIVIPKTDVGICYQMYDIDLVASQISKRIYLVEENGEQHFMQTDYNEKDKKYYIENAITNLLPNPQFAGVGDKPDLWEIDAPSIIVNSFIEQGEIDGTNLWIIRASSTNIFSAFNSVTLKTSTKYDLYTGLNALTFSVFYKVDCDFKEIPFHNFEAKLNFFFNEDYLRSEEISIVATKEKDVWRLLSLTLQGSQIPVGANKYTVELTIANLENTNLFQVQFYLPQLEPSPCATTRTVDARIQDKFMTGTTFELKMPFYILLKTYYVSGVWTRGLCSSTTNQKNGFEFLASNDRLRFKWYDASGRLVLNVASNPFPMSLNNNDIIDYGLWVTQSNIEFYVNNMMLSSHPNSITVDQNQYYIVGALEKSNTTINSELLDFKVLKFKP